MMARKSLKILAAAFIFLLCVLAAFLSNSTSTNTPFDNSSAGVAPVHTLGSVEGASISQTPDGISAQNSDDSSLSSENDTSTPQEEGAQIYQVVNVVDGDTLDLEIDGAKTRVRVIGIDTPETVDPRKPVQCFGIEASNEAKTLLTGQYVTIESDPTQGDKDKYGRLLRYIYLPNGTDYGLYMISNGYAHEYTYNIPYDHQAQYKQAQADAMNGNKGLWSPDTCSGNK